MQRITTGTFRVFTFKDGLLSRVAHDLQLSLERFEVVLADGQVTGTFWPESLKVDGAVVDGRLDRDGLRDKDRREIQGNVTDKILNTRRFPTAKLIATRSGDVLTGTLELAGRLAPIRLSLQVSEGIAKGEVELVPTQWGIAPYKALLGAIKLQDRVKVVFELPLS